ncbi:MAG: preprotein translocase subunit SecE [Clostridia bacterium]|jgi:preprotein translocase subunit SecE|nr:preprotein translocase subunit SecE [Clostridia bacterium]
MAKEKSPKKKPSIFQRIGNYFRDIISEIKKIVWPAPKATFRNTGIVLVSMLIVGLVIFGLDSGLHWLFGLVMDLAGN